MKTKLSLLMAAALLISLAAAASHPAPIAAEVSLKNIEPFSYCAIKHKGTYPDMDEIVTQLMNVMYSQNINPAGELLAIYHATPEKGLEKTTEWEIGFPVLAQIAVVREPLIKGEWNHTQVAVATHTGAYENTGDTIEEMFAWMEETGYEQAGPVLGKFLNIMTENVRTDNLKTEIWIPCKKK